MAHNTATNTERLFFALWPNEAERDALAAWQPPLQKLCGGRITPAGKLHNTLVFLGEVEVNRLEALQLAVQEVCAAEFELEFGVARYWGHNHIVYAAPYRIPSKLAQLVSHLEQALISHRFKFDKRPYKPHVTLMRHAHWTDSPLPEMPQLHWKIRDFALVQSISEGQGVRYEVLARFPLERPC